MSTIGHNSNLAKDFLDRIEPLYMQIQSIKDDIKEFSASAKEKGIDVRALKAVIKERLQTAEQKKKAEEHQEAVAMMKHSLGMLADTPLGQAALRG